MDPQKKAHWIVQKQMLDADAFSQWLGIEILELKPGFVRLVMKVRADMCNGFGIVHGGICHALADSAIAFASNSLGRKALTIESTMHYYEKALINDELIVITHAESVKHRLAVYRVDVLNQHQKLVSSFKGTVIRTKEEWS